MLTLIRNGTLVTSTSVSKADLLIEDDKVAEVGPQLPFSAERIIDATNCYVLPGGVDVHTHLDMPLFDGLHSADDFLSGTVAAALGGTTTIIDYAAQTRGQSLEEALGIWQARAQGKAAIDYGFHMSLAEYTPAVADQMKNLAADGVTSFKLFTAYPGRFMLDDAALFGALQQIRAVGALACVHAENGSVIDILTAQALARGETAAKNHALTRPVQTEAEAISRVANLADMAGAPLYVVHLSSGLGLAQVAAAQDRGLPVYAETCPQYLLLDETRYDQPGVEGLAHVMSPPLRSQDNLAALWQGLAAGRIQTVATDHCPFPLDQKRRGEGDFSRTPGGVPGIETRMLLLYDAGVLPGRISLSQWVALSASNPAKLFGLYPRKGSLAKGSDADIAILSPEASQILRARTLHMKVDFNPYEGRQIRGAFAKVMARGRLIVDDGRFLGQPGAGEFLPRKGPGP